MGRNPPNRAHHRQRALRVASDSPTRLVRRAQPSRCRGNRIDWYTRPVSLHPQELDATAVPAASRWHVSSGIAHPADDGTPWCRSRHPHPTRTGHSLTHNRTGALPPGRRGSRFAVPDEARWHPNGVGRAGRGTRGLGVPGCGRASLAPLKRQLSVAIPLSASEACSPWLTG
ncbi:DUF6083 domain-containing protein [Streptomyces sp. NPDC058092]|uniref:DUF6083 domain-containing protein n=1 Tax=Streptomyces sp. NPDC058092 TaxID=3346336 RepID=UPI0036EA9940